MKKIILQSGLLLALCWAGVEPAWAYYIEFFYAPHANHAQAHGIHVYNYNQFTEDWTTDDSQGTATALAWTPSEGPSAIAQVVTSPISTGLAATMNLQVTERTANSSYAYGLAYSYASFTVVQEPEDHPGQVPVRLAFHVTGTFDLHTRAYSNCLYDFYLNGAPMRVSSGGPPVLDDLFVTTLPLTVGLPYTFEVSLEGSLHHTTQQFDSVLYQATLDIQAPQTQTPLPSTILLLGSGLLGLGLLGRWTQRG